MIGVFSKGDILEVSKAMAANSFSHLVVCCLSRRPQASFTRLGRRRSNDHATVVSSSEKIS